MIPALEPRICQYLDQPPAALYQIGVGSADPRESTWRQLLTLWSTMRLYGCEPYPSRYRQLADRFPGTLLHVALGAAAGRMMLPGTPQLGDLDSMQPVDVWTLDQFDRRCGRRDRVLLWLNVAGSELDVLQAGRELLSSGRVRWVNIEADSNHRERADFWRDMARIRRELGQHGFRLAEAYNLNRGQLSAIHVLDYDLPAVCQFCGNRTIGLATRPGGR